MLDFDLEISDGTDGRHRVMARSTAGETGPIEVSFPYDDAGLASALDVVNRALRQSATSPGALARADEQLVQRIGGDLFAFAFPAEVREDLRAARLAAADRGAELRVRLRLGGDKLAALPWELLYDAGRGEYMALATPFVRYMDVREPHRALAVRPPLQILGMTAQPDDLGHLDVGEERRRLQEALDDLQATGEMRLTWVEGQTWRDLERHLDQGKVHVIHFIGHGGFDPQKGEGYLAFAGEDGSAQTIWASGLARLLAGQHLLGLAVLNSCESARASAHDRFSSTSALLIRRGIPAVVAMQHQITDTAAITFSRGLYGAIARQLPVETAVARARRAIDVDHANSLEWATPVLYLRSTNGQIFDLTALAAGDAEPGSPAPTPQAATEKEKASDVTKGQPISTTVTPVHEATLTHPDQLSDLTVNTDGSRLATITKDQTAFLWETGPGWELSRLTPPQYLPPAVKTASALAVSPDTTQLATAALGGQPPTAIVRVCDLTTGAEVQSLVPDAPSEPSDQAAGDYISSLTYSPDGSLLVAAGQGVDVLGVGTVWNVETGHKTARLTGHPRWIQRTTFSHDGRRLMTTDAVDTAIVWEASDGRRVTQMLHSKTFHEALNGDGTRVATCSRTDGVLLWDADSGRRLTRVTDSSEGIHAAPAFSPQNDCFAYARYNRVLLWDLTTRRETASLYHQAWVGWLTYSPDGRILATTGDNLVYLWDPHMGQELARLTHDATVRKLAFTSDGTRLATSSDDNSVRIWKV